jgi:ankyrin repeat protein
MDPRIGSTPPKLPRQPAHYRGSKGWLLYKASIYGSLETFTLLQDRGANLEYAHALHGAAYGGPSQIPIIHHLLDNKYLDVNELDIYHLPHTGTPLLAATMAGHTEVVRILLEYGANPHACKKSPNEATTISTAQALARRDEEASKAILIMLKEAIEKWQGDPADAPVSSVPGFPERRI